jgi:hypothetical protein
VYKAKGLFGWVFEGLKSVFNIQKIHLKKKMYLFGKKKLKTLLKIQNAKQWSKRTFGKSLKMKLFPKNTF